MQRYQPVHGEGPDVEFEKDSTGEWVRYKDVAEDLALLSVLFAAGVDNWEGYEEALNMLSED
jgi:hypothetical protein